MIWKPENIQVQVKYSSEGKCFRHNEDSCSLGCSRHYENDMDEWEMKGNEVAQTE